MQILSWHPVSVDFPMLLKKILHRLLVDFYRGCVVWFSFFSSITGREEMPFGERKWKGRAGEASQREWSAEGEDGREEREK